MVKLLLSNLIVAKMLWKEKTSWSDCFFANAADSSDCTILVDLPLFIWIEANTASNLWYNDTMKWAKQDSHGTRNKDRKKKKQTDIHSLDKTECIKWFTGVVPFKLNDYNRLLLNVSIFFVTNFVTNYATSL